MWPLREQRRTAKTSLAWILAVARRAMRACLYLFLSRLRNRSAPDQPAGGGQGWCRCDWQSQFFQGVH